MNEFRKAKEFVNDNFAGILEETEEGYHFQYDEEYLKDDNSEPVSLTLPLTNKEYSSISIF